MIILYHKYKDKYPDQSTSSRGSAIFSYQQSSRMLETHTPHQLIDEELRRETSEFRQNMQKGNNIKGKLNRHNLRSKSVDLQVKKRYKTEIHNNSFCNLDSDDFITTPIENRFSCGLNFADTVRASQNHSSTLCNDETMMKVLDDIKELKDLLAQRIESDKQKESREELKRQNEEKQLEIEAIENENKRLKKELEEQRTRLEALENEKLEALENEKFEENFEYLGHTNRAVMDMTYREKLFATYSISSDSKNFGKRQESSSVRLSFENH